jgi:hypothetical protein
MTTFSVIGITARGLAIPAVTAVTRAVITISGGRTNTIVGMTRKVTAASITTQIPTLATPVKIICNVTGIITIAPAILLTDFTVQAGRF